MDDILDKRAGFQKGEVTNPNGRPKGSQNENTKRWNQIRKLASADYEAAYLELRTAMQNSEGWAFQIFYSKLVPKKANEDSIEVAMPTAVNNEGAQIFLTRFIESLGYFDELTKDEILAVIKTLNVVKLVEKVNEDKEILDFFSNDEITSLDEFTQKAKERKNKAQKFL